MPLSFEPITWSLNSSEADKERFCKWWDNKMAERERERKRQLQPEPKPESEPEVEPEPKPQSEPQSQLQPQPQSWLQSPQPPPQPSSGVRLGLQRRVPSVTCASRQAPAEPVRMRRMRGRGSTARRRHCRAIDPAIAARCEQLATAIATIQAAVRSFLTRRRLHRLNLRPKRRYPISTLLGLRPPTALSAAAPKFTPRRRNSYYGYEYARRCGLVDSYPISAFAPILATSAPLSTSAPCDAPIKVVAGDTTIYIYMVRERA